MVKTDKEVTILTWHQKQKNILSPYHPLTDQMLKNYLYVGNRALQN